MIEFNFYGMQNVDENAKLKLCYWSKFYANNIEYKDDDECMPIDVHCTYSECWTLNQISICVSVCMFDLNMRYNVVWYCVVLFAISLHTD